MGASHAVAVLLDDDLVTFNRVVGVVRRRNLPITGIAVGPSHMTGVSRLTFFTEADDAAADRLVRQLEKTFGVRAAALYRADDAVVREVALIKLRALPAARADLLAALSAAGATLVAERDGTCIVEIAGESARTDACLQALDRFGILEVARSGAVALQGLDGAGSPPPSTTLSAPHSSEVTL
ncbi:MAG TPA: acetolactate synthase small subunit [Gemmatimonadales bacterium]|nr:acetolactate synthase small subunit [Gemmatimonadales bacterium]